MAMVVVYPPRLNVALLNNTLSGLVGAKVTIVSDDNIQPIITIESATIVSFTEDSIEYSVEGEAESQTVLWSTVRSLNVLEQSVQSTKKK